MDFATWTPFITAIAAISGILLGWAGRSRSIRQDVERRASADAQQRADVEYIKRGVDDIRFEQKAQGKRIDELSDRVTRVEESAKQAHKRLDRIDDEN
ncbi:hypothetical protein HPY27_01505 [Brevibacillus sp. HB1.1]|uniref:hypothetical protein n=1 Tax=Brevibacillus sp. HB1.1 TaxID=2738808 RepID=UPI001575CAD2|nr:hypothetical protein [Brevibacillus sp. HB1.1]NTU28836.1 hypothetical protein [Brevibacillus sp. HB1.1]